MNILGTPLLLLALLPAEGKPTPKFPLGKETTYVTGPLDKEGYIDYEAALNERLGKGITPERNANVLIWKALGPRPEGGSWMPAPYFKRLGIVEPPKDGAYFIGMHVYAKERLKLDPLEPAGIYDQMMWASQRAWTAKDYPHIAAWLKVNENPLVIVIEATKRPDYFNPLIVRRTEKEPATLISALLPSAQGCRDLSEALTVRALLHVGERRFDEAWQDLLACHRLGRLVARGATGVEGLVGRAIGQRANHAALEYIERAKLTSGQVQDRLKDLQNLPPISPLTDKVDLYERFTYLEMLQLVRRGGIGKLVALYFAPVPEKPDAEMEKALAKIDWEKALRSANRWFDRSVGAMRIKDRAVRVKELEKIEAEIKALRKEPTEDAIFFNLLGQEKKPLDMSSVKLIEDGLIGWVLPRVNIHLQNAQDRIEQEQRNLHLAFALDACNRDHNRYPAKLDDLAPKYLATIPNDLFSGKPLLYRPSDRGYLLYSVGVNGIDEEGRSSDDEPRGDDLRVRMPLPELKRK